jgi:DNA topoisomerase-2
MKDMPKILSTKPQFLEKKPKNAEEEGEDENEEQQVEKEEDLYKEYSYLLNMSIWSLSFEKVEAMKKEVKTKEEELNVVEKTTLEMMWVNDLDQFLLMLDEVEVEEEKSRLNRPQVKGNAGKKRARPKKKVEETKEDDSEKVKPKKKTTKPKKEEESKTPSETKQKPSETKPKPVVKKQQQATINFPKKEEEKPTTKTQLPLLERIADRIQASTSFQSALEDNTQGDKRKAPGDLQGKPVARKKFVDLEDSLEFLEGEKENLDSINKDSAVVIFVFW